MTVKALARACQLLEELAGGKARPLYGDNYPGKPGAKRIELHPGGQPLDRSVIADLQRGRILHSPHPTRGSMAAVMIEGTRNWSGNVAWQPVEVVRPADVDTLLHPHFDPVAKDQARRDGTCLASGVNASPGAAVGVAAFDADLAEEWGLAGKAVIMVRPETKPDDVHGMIAAKGILTSRGGATSHAAVVARQFGKPAVVGCEAVEIDLAARILRVNGTVLKEGDWLSIDGTSGEVFAGQLPTQVNKGIGGHHTGSAGRCYDGEPWAGGQLRRIQKLPRSAVRLAVIKHQLAPETRCLLQ